MTRAWAAATAAILLISACGGDAPRTAPSDAGLFYAAMARTLTRPDAVAHLSAVTSGSVDDHPYAKQEELWLDPAGDRARVEVTTGFAEPGAQASQVRIIAGRAAYVRQADAPVARVQAPACRSAPSAVIATVLGCHGNLESASVRVESSAFEGRATVALVAEGTAPRSDEVRGFTDALHLDAATMLPVALVSAGSYDFGGTHAFETVTRFTVAFERFDALPPDFFDPASIGYTARDVLADVRAATGSIAVYWAGARYEPDGGAPLTLATVFAVGDAASGFIGPRVTLAYRDGRDEFAAPSVFVHLWRAGDWARAGRTLPHRTLGNVVAEIEASPGSLYADPVAAERLLEALAPFAE